MEMVVLPEKSLAKSLRLTEIDCIDRKEAPTCEVCETEQATAATLDRNLGLVENVCPGCLNDELEVVVSYI